MFHVEHAFCLEPLGDMKSVSGELERALERWRFHVKQLQIGIVAIDCRRIAFLVGGVFHVEQGCGRLRQPRPLFHVEQWNRTEDPLHGGLFHVGTF